MKDSQGGQLLGTKPATSLSLLAISSSLLCRAASRSASAAEDAYSLAGGWIVEGREVEESSKGLVEEGSANGLSEAVMRFGSRRGWGGGG